MPGDAALKTRTGALVRALGGLPLAIAVAGEWLRRGEVSVDELIARLVGSQHEGAAAVFEEVLAERIRVLGPDHPVAPWPI